MEKTGKLWVWIALLAVLSPLGLLLPEVFKAGAAWGEWGAEEIKKIYGGIPAGMKELSDLWRPLMPGYAFRGWEGPVQQGLAYILSAVIGVSVTAAAVTLAVRIMSKKDAGSRRGQE